jgi:hypothetical protein
MDAFGHSNGIPRLFADIGFEAVFMSRADAEYKTQKANQREL